MATDEHYRRLLAFRTQLRRFDHWSSAAAAEHGLTHAQHQLLLAVRGHDAEQGPTIGDVAAYLLVKHHTAGELADRVVELGLVERVRVDTDHRFVRLRLTSRGRHIVEELAETHVEELNRLAAVWIDTVERPASLLRSVQARLIAPRRDRSRS